ncbi:LuxR C-terminal-related transcriptional regulator [Streptomyces sp. SA15]|uniref:LuxR C-terminal-related transcriptional regulator n=1 Tax=Streptomyces sp. SA15 TaxID=934019 RepID=UPI00211CECAF|nr:LuxR C-terminal-related transcriptional regulator [Streptomyces sp. SA15]
MRGLPDRFAGSCSAECSVHRLPNPDTGERQTHPRLDRLTGRECEILLHLAEGLSNSELADRLKLAPGRAARATRGSRQPESAAAQQGSPGQITHGPDAQAAVRVLTAVAHHPRAESALSVLSTPVSGKGEETCSRASRTSSCAATSS